MENELKNMLEDCIDDGFVRGIISNPRTRLEDSITKILIRPVMIGKKLVYQATEYVGTQVFHHNYSNDEIKSYMQRMIENSFKQCEISTTTQMINILVSKKGKVTIKKKQNILRNKNGNPDKCGDKSTYKDLDKNTGKNTDMNTDMNTGKSTDKRGKSINSCNIPNFNIMPHNREKNYILKEGVPVPFLIDLGVMKTNGEVIKARYDKFKQINRFLEFIRDVVKSLPKDRQINIIDFGCGKSYLTFAIYYYLHELLGMDVSITGLDLKKDVIEKCNRCANDYGYEKLVFKNGDIADYNEQDNVDMVVTLHACDTATDYALYKAVKWNARVILSVPCCQHEINKQISNDVMKPLLGYGILKERMSALMTDCIRAEVLKLNGYSADILEFIDMEHTPKNLLIRAVRSGEKGDKERLMEMISKFGLEPTILKLL